MHFNPRVLAAAVIVATVLLGGTGQTDAQTQGTPEEFTAIAMAANELGSGAGVVQIRINRWSTAAEREALAKTLREKGPEALLEALRNTRSVGTIRTPDSLAYNLRYAHQEPGKDGGRRIVIGTDRPISFWEYRSGARSLEYPFTVIQMEIGSDGQGRGTLSYATRVIPAGRDTIILENFATSPVMLTEVRSVKTD